MKTLAFIFLISYITASNLFADTATEGELLSEINAAQKYASGMPLTQKEIKEASLGIGYVQGTVEGIIVGSSVIAAVANLKGPVLKCYDTKVFTYPALFESLRSDLLKEPEENINNSAAHFIFMSMANHNFLSIVDCPK